MKRPIVSVVMPAFNAERYISRAIESILKQTLSNFELIIVDDASKDNTVSIINSYKRKDKRIKLIKNPQNLRVARSLNIGISTARSDLIARMDADDIALPKRLETQYLFMKKHPQVAISGTDISIVDENENVISKREYPTQSEELKKIMLRYSPFAHPTVVFRKKIFEEFEGYDVTEVLCEDLDLWFKIGTKYKLANIPEKLLKYTLLNSSGTHANLRKQELVGFKVKARAVYKHGYKLSFYDVIYNIAQFITMWTMPVKFRINLYNALRSRRLI